MNRATALLGLTLLLTACGGATPPPTQQPTNQPSPSPSPEVSPPAESGFYLRAWYTQALPPEVTFNWLPILTISDGLAIDGNVAIPLIYPGPLLVLPNARTLSENGQAEIVTLARELGLLDGTTDFTGGGLPPGGQLAHVLIMVDGVSYELAGDPGMFDGTASPEPGSPQAFGAFWAQISYLDDWLAGELGAFEPFQPERLALVAASPQEPEAELQPEIMPWPLETDFSELGQPFPLGPDGRCATIEGEQLETLLPVLLEANQLTWFIDAEEEVRSLIARPLVPGEPEPCGS